MPTPPPASRPSGGAIDVLDVCPLDTLLDALERRFRTFVLLGEMETEEGIDFRVLLRGSASCANGMAQRGANIIQMIVDDQDQRLAERFDAFLHEDTEETE